MDMVERVARMIGRREPYTQIGIRRLTCAVHGCENRGEFQWQCCANGNLWTPLCADHDVDLNRLVLDWMGHPDREALMNEYAARVGRQGDGGCTNPPLSHPLGEIATMSTLNARENKP